jgi:hypothetical protein
MTTPTLTTTTPPPTAKTPIRIDIIKAAENDWLEFCNPSDTAISTKGLYLSDNSNDLFKWQMPAIIIQGGDSIMIVGNDYSGDEPYLKRAITNFDLAFTEQLFLTDSTGKIVAQWSFTPISSTALITTAIMTPTVTTSPQSSTAVTNSATATTQTITEPTTTTAMQIVTTTPITTIASLVTTVKIPPMPAFTPAIAEGNPKIGDALEILKFLAGLRNDVNLPAGTPRPTIGDALEILKFLAKMPSVFENY